MRTMYLSLLLSLGFCLGKAALAADIAPDPGPPENFQGVSMAALAMGERHCPWLSFRWVSG